MHAGARAWHCQGGASCMAVARLRFCSRLTRSCVHPLIASSDAAAGSGSAQLGQGSPQPLPALFARGGARRCETGCPQTRQIALQAASCRRQPPARAAETRSRPATRLLPCSPVPPLHRHSQGAGVLADAGLLDLSSLAPAWPAKPLLLRLLPQTRRARSSKLWAPRCKTCRGEQHSTAQPASASRWTEHQNAGTLPLLRGAPTANTPPPCCSSCCLCSGGDQALKTNFESEHPSSWWGPGCCLPARLPAWRLWLRELASRLAGGPTRWQLPGR